MNMCMYISWDQLPGVTGGITDTGLEEPLSVTAKPGVAGGAADDAPVTGG